MKEDNFPELVSLVISPDEWPEDFYITIPANTIPDDLQPGDHLDIEIGGEDYGGDVVEITFPDD